jgi:hypothetical protein
MYGSRFSFIMACFTAGSGMCNFNILKNFANLGSSFRATIGGKGFVGSLSKISGSAMRG